MAKFLDLRRLLDGETDTVDFYDEFPLADKSYDIKDGVCEVKGVVTNHSGFIEFSAVFTLKYNAVCAMCGKIFGGETCFQAKYPLAESLENADEDDEYYLISSGELDLDDVCESSIILNLPSRFLCKENCKGLCLKCGADLNEGVCSCAEKGIDPRLAKLKEYLNKN